MRPVLACKNPWRFLVAGLRTGLKRRRLRRASTTCAKDLHKQGLFSVFRIVASDKPTYPISVGLIGIRSHQ